MKAGPASFVFKILRLLFLCLLILSLVLFILGIVFSLGKFRKISQWKDDSWLSSTDEQRKIQDNLKVSTYLSAATVGIGFLNLIIGFYAIITLRMGALLLFTLFAFICTILTSTQLYYDDGPEVTIGWLIVDFLQIISLIVMIREIRIYEGDQIRKRVAASDPGED